MINPNIEAEQCVLDQILTNAPKMMPKAVNVLNEDDFLVPYHKRVFSVCKSMFLQDKPIDIITISHELGNNLKDGLYNIIGSAVTTENFNYYAKIIKDTAKKVKARYKAQELEQALETLELEECQSIAVNLCETLNSTQADTVVSAAEGFKRFMDTKLFPKKYIQTGFERLDKYTYIDKGDYIVIGGRPSAGKTAFTLQLMLNMAKNYKVAFFSLETSADKIFDRLMANYSVTPMSEIKKGNIQEWSRIEACKYSFPALKLHVVGAAGWTVAQIKAKAVELGADIIFIDYLSLIKSSGKSIYERVTNISIDLHTMAQQSQITVVALSQLKRLNNTPDMDSLRESGQIEQDADIVIILHEEDESRPNERILKIAKNKEGRIGNIKLRFEGEYQRFNAIDTQHGS